MSSSEHAVDPRPSTSEQRISAEDSDAECVRRCEQIVSGYRRGETSKSDAVLALHQTLLDAPSIKSGTEDSLPIALGLYLKMLDEVDRSTERAHR